MKKIEIEYDNEIYYFINNKFLDSSYLQVPDAIGLELARIYFSKMDYKSMSTLELLEYIKSIKQSNYTYKLEETCEYGLEKFFNDEYFIKSVLPMYLSVLRIQGKPQKAIEVGQRYRLATYTSVPFFTSLAAAYCDIQDYDNARKYANIAYAMQNGGQGYQTELSLVFARIKKETK